MKQIVLRDGSEVIVDDEDFEKVSKHRWYLMKSTNKTSSYAVRKSGRKNVLMHREILHAPKLTICDHINGNGLDNRKANLRLCTREQNARNRRLNSNSKTGLKGVYKNGKKYRAQIRYCNTKVYLGRFSTPEEAYEEYKHVARQLFGDYLNST